MHPKAAALALLLACLAAAPSLAEPGACAPDGGLDYYRCRAADFRDRNPSDAAPEYYLAYGDRYVRRFSAETRPLLSPAGRAWLDRVRAGLQAALEAQRARDPAGFARLERDRSAFLDFAYATHPAAYFAAGLEALPVRDLLIIGSTPDLQDLLTPRGLAQVLAILRGLAGSCAREGPGPCLAERVVRELTDRRRLAEERLRLGPTTTLGRWWLERLLGSARRALGVDPAPPRPTRGIAAALGSPGK